jgi:hypothetical protein
MPGVFQLLDTLRNKLDCTLWHLRQQLRPSLRTSEIRLRRTVRTDFLLRVPAALGLVISVPEAQSRRITMSSAAKKAIAHRSSRGIRTTEAKYRASLIYPKDDG